MRYALLSSRRRHDPALLPLVGARDAEERERRLYGILDRHAAPLVQKLLGGAVVRGELSAEDVQDLTGEVMLRLVDRLHRLGEEPLEPIASLPDYVAATVYHARNDFRRRRQPLRSRLAHRVRYVLTHTRGLTLWGRDPALCGLSRWAGGPPVAVAAVAGLPAGDTEDPDTLRRVVEDVLRRSEGAVTLESLVDALAAAQGLSCEPFVPATALAAQAAAADPLVQLADRQALHRLWVEIEALPVNQRRALLLQLGLDGGESVAAALDALGVVSVRRLAAALELPLAELLELWNELPLADQRIAAMLGVTRQQVINLRKAARDRLARRLGRPR